MQKVMITFLLAVMTLAAGWHLPAMAAQDSPYNYLPAEALKVKLEKQESLNLVDIQVAKEFDDHHLPGALATYAYPVKSAEELGRLDALLPQLQANGDAVVIVCPRGEGGAKRTYDHLLAKGVAAERLFILEKGQEGWPYPELTKKSAK